MAPGSLTEAIAVGTMTSVGLVATVLGSLSLCDIFFRTEDVTKRPTSQEDASEPTQFCRFSNLPSTVVANKDFFHLNIARNPSGESPLTVPYCDLTMYSTAYNFYTRSSVRIREGVHEAVTTRCSASPQFCHSAGPLD